MSALSSSWKRTMLSLKSVGNDLTATWTTTRIWLSPRDMESLSRNIWSTLGPLHVMTVTALQAALAYGETETLVCSFPEGGGGYSSEFLVGVCRPVPQILTQFQTKICHFPHPFSDLASKIHTRFQTFVVP